MQEYTVGTVPTTEKKIYNTLQLSQLCSVTKLPLTAYVAVS